MPTVVIPFASKGCEHRIAALDWVSGQYRVHHPDWQVMVIEDTNGGPWSKGDLVNKGIKMAPEGIVIVADADVWTDGLPSAAMAVTCGAAEWVVPHSKVWRLVEESTAAVLNGAGWRGQRTLRPYAPLSGGGIVVAERQTLLDVPMDPRFIGWGQEDESWGFALKTLAGDPWRGQADLLHLWHPTPERQDRRVGNMEGWRLMKRYGKLAKAHDAEGMRRLISQCRSPS